MVEPRDLTRFLSPLCSFLIRDQPGCFTGEHTPALRVTPLKRGFLKSPLEGSAGEAGRGVARLRWTMGYPG
jgi:hypothetical protein